MKHRFLCVLLVGMGSVFPVFADDFVTGSSTNADVPLNSASNWTTIREASITIPASDAAKHGCVVTASADVHNPGPATRENQYRFTLEVDNSNPVTDSLSERTVELVDNPGTFDDPDSQPIATTRTFGNLTRTNGPGGTGKHTFYFLGRKVEAGDSDTKVLDVSLTVICVHTL